MSKRTRRYTQHEASQQRRPTPTYPATLAASAPDPYSAMKAATRARFRDLWERAERGESLKGKEARIVKVMRDHPEYATL